MNTTQDITQDITRDRDEARELCNQWEQENAACIKALERATRLAEDNGRLAHNLGIANAELIAMLRTIREHGGFPDLRTLDTCDELITKHTAP
jgi:dihydroorotase-like cyclic amidohydrolase